MRRTITGSVLLGSVEEAQQLTDRETGQIGVGAEPYRAEIHANIHAGTRVGIFSIRRAHEAEEREGDDPTTETAASRNVMRS